MNPSNLISICLCLVLGACTSPRDRRGVDWMKWYDEERAFQHEPIDWSLRRSPWYRNYHTMEEIQQMWKDAMKQIKDREELECERLNTQ